MGLLTKLGEGIGGVFGAPELGRQLGGIGDVIFGTNGGGGFTEAAGGFGTGPGPGGLPALTDPRTQPRVPGIPELPTFGFGPDQQPTGNGQFSDQISTLLGGDRIVMPTQQKVINTAPPGWVVVDMPDGSGKRAVRKEVARCLGLWKPRKKPPISASDWGKLKAANRVVKKAKKVAQTANFKCVKK